MFDVTVQSVFDHVAQVYGDDGTSAYDQVEPMTTDSAWRRSRRLLFTAEHQRREFSA
jgi:hypothetical protein